MSASQRRAINDIGTKWQLEKSRLLAAMDGFAPSRGRLDQVQASMMDYSRLSNEYDSMRSRSWAQATALLTEAQRKVVAP
ncbi:MAG: hypothetical protein JST30_01580 [Armatimonadetes bacterium]|nr:hypothetical protein [Armatimonadota bacterium]